MLCDAAVPAIFLCLFSYIYLSVSGTFCVCSSVFSPRVPSRMSCHMIFVASHYLKFPLKVTHHFCPILLVRISVCVYVTSKSFFLILPSPLIWNSCSEFAEHWGLMSLFLSLWPPCSFLSLQLFFLLLVPHREHWLRLSSCSLPGLVLTELVYFSCHQLFPNLCGLLA